MEAADARTAGFLHAWIQLVWLVTMALFEGTRSDVERDLRTVIALFEPQGEDLWVRVLRNQITDKLYGTTTSWREALEKDQDPYDGEEMSLVEETIDTDRWLYCFEMTPKPKMIIHEFRKVALVEEGQVLTLKTRTGLIIGSWSDAEEIAKAKTKLSSLWMECQGLGRYWLK